MKRTPKLEVFEGSDSHWYWRLKAGNGEIQCPSEGYKNKAGAVRGAKAAQSAMARAVIEVTTKAK